MCIVEMNSPGAMLRTGFWLAPRRQDQTMEDKYLLLYLLTCPERTSIGLYPLNVAISAARVGWDKQQFLSVLNRLVKQSEVSVHGYWVLVHTWWDHNSRPGPGFESQITTLLAEAPLKLIEKWEEISYKAKILPFSWEKTFVPTAIALPTENNALNKREIETKDGTPPSTPPGTPGTRGGNNNVKDKRNNNEKENENKQTNSASSQAPISEGYDDKLDALLEPLSKLQKIDFLQTCKKMALSHSEAYQLAYEFSTRQVNSETSPKIKHTKKWLEGVVLSSRSTGNAISKCDLNTVAKNMDSPKKDCNQKSTAFEKDIEATQGVELNNLATELIRTLTDRQIEALILKTLELIPPSFKLKFEDEVTTKLLQRSIPIGLVGNATKRALMQLDYVEEHFRSVYASHLGGA